LITWQWLNRVVAIVAVLNRWRWLLALLISAGLLAWLVWRISPEELAEAASRLPLVWLGIWTAGLVFALYCWDVVCLRWLFAQPDRTLSLRVVGGARAHSYVWSALNYGAGQAVLGWNMARAQEVPLASALSRCVLLVLHDAGVLIGLALIGVLACQVEEATARVWILVAGLGVLGSLALAFWLLPLGLRERIAGTNWGLWLGWWTWRHSFRLVILRVVYYGLIVAYAVLALEHCDIDLEFRVIFGVIPLVLLADSLPSISGFGTRETALVMLLPVPVEQQAVILSFSLFWSAGLLTGRALIGLGNWWLVPAASWMLRCGPKEHIHGVLGDGSIGTGR
jgi:hypothetical protein